MVEPKSNTPELSVSELSGALKRTIEEAFGYVRLRGEISGYRGPVGSGHVYFSLKDANAKIDAVIWKGVFQRLRVKPEEGLEVIATGKITTFAGKSSYQIIIDSLEPAGVGALMALLEERKKKLAAEGLFDPARKQLLPYIPDIIGVVTSPTGAVIRDILHRLSDRFPRHVLVWPVRVQGETAAGEIAAAIQGFNSIEPGGPIPRPDVLIVARGGGSLEDLWAFNEEIVARAAAMSEIPLVSAVGHETDTTLIDFVSDVRAPTPTAAAEMVVPVRADLLATSRELGSRLIGGLNRGMERRRTELRSAARALPSPEGLMATPRQRIDVAALKLSTSLRAGLERRATALSDTARRLAGQTPQARLARFAERVNGLAQLLRRSLRGRMDQRSQRLDAASKGFFAAFSARLTLERRDIERRREKLAGVAARLPRAFAGRLEERRAKLHRLDSLLNSLGYRQVLARGFAIVKDATGQTVRHALGIEAGAALRLQFIDGEVTAVAGEGARAKPKARPPSGPGGQGTLF